VAGDLLCGEPGEVVAVDAGNQEALASSDRSAAEGARGFVWGRWTEEVRLAMAWNGGVSLAVWMGGVAVEIDAARRARGEPQNMKAEPPKTAAAARSTASLYAAICNAFDRRFVVDILTGASAGGLNGTLLAGAMMHGRELGTNFMRDRWLAIGDFGRLLHSLDTQKPPSVMQGTEFLTALNDAFAELLATTGPPKSDRSEPPVVLDVQATNVLGEQHCFMDDWGQAFYASEFRAPIRFRKPADYTAEVLAVAARASASFPAAFEPQQLLGHVATLAGLAEKERFAIDGGLLENAPIRPAIEMIPRRRANAPVKRYVCYVNAAPTARADSRPDAAQPGLIQVLSYTINLPRDGRVIDQLNTLDETSRRAGTTTHTGVKLVALSTAVTAELARALLPTYQQRRAILALDELLEGTTGGSGPGAAREVLVRLGKDVADAGSRGDPVAGVTQLPFIPTALEPPTTDKPWQWGARAAQRIVQLELDMLRAILLSTRSEDDADSIFETRPHLDDALSELDGFHDDFIRDENVLEALADLRSKQQAERKAALTRLNNYTRDYGEAIRTCLERATETFKNAYTNLTADAREAAKLPPPAALFGPATDVMQSDFVRRALAVEVIRRSFADDYDLDGAANLHIAQLTPLIRSPLFDMGNPAFGEQKTKDGHNGTGTNGRCAAAADPALGPQTSMDKLAGLRLNHFAGFYRASWRANDFMWGRLDGAAAIARTLIEGNRARILAAHWSDSPELEPAKQLARALVSSGDAPGDADRRELIWEVIRPDADAPPPQDAAALRDALAAKLREDLADEERDAELTWAICARALQYEALREEASILVEQTARDKEAGAFYANIAWSTNGSLKEPINDLRKGRGREALPYRLGCDRPDEATSTLALRTLSRTFLVAFAALGGVIPLTRALAPVRMPLLSVQGSTTPRILDRIAVLLGFTGAAWYLSARWATIPEDAGSNIPLKALWAPQTLALWVCILGVLGVAAVPAVRALRTVFRDRRIWQATVCLGLLASAGVLGLAFQWWKHGIIEALTTWHATYRPPEELLWVVAAVGGFHVASILDRVLKYSRPLFRPFRKRMAFTSLVVGGTGAALAYYSATGALIPQTDNGGWITVTCAAAFAAPVIAAIELGARGLIRLSAKRARAWKAERANGRAEAGQVVTL
jgi:patatin-related protein